MKSMITKAHDFAKRAHVDQLRKYTNLPYITHPENVARLLWQFWPQGVLDEYFAASLLHDVVEDTNVDINTVEKMFGADVSQLVSELTENKAEKKALTSKIYFTKKINNMSEWAFTIKMCDRIDNIRDCLLPVTPLDFVKYYVKQTNYILNHLDRRINDKQFEMIVYLRKLLFELSVNF